MTNPYEIAYQQSIEDPNSFLGQSRGGLSLV